MGDRCYLRIKVRRQDEKLWAEVAGEEKIEGWLDLDEPDDGKSPVLEGSIEEVNYGWVDELMKAAELGCVFEGRHEAGYDYDAEEFGAIGGKLFIYAVAQNGAPAVELDEETLELTPECKKALREAFDGIRKAGEHLDSLSGTLGNEEDE